MNVRQARVAKRRERNRLAQQKYRREARVRRARSGCLVARFPGGLWKRLNYVQAPWAVAISSASRWHMSSTFSDKLVMTAHDS